MLFSSVIVVPIYNSSPSEIEIRSFRNNIEVLSNHLFSMMTYEGLDISIYTDILDEKDINYRIDCFDKSYFDSLLSYNSLLLSKLFYEQYSTFEYMLVMQLDVYIFKDEFAIWCEKGYDYIGAPWFDRFRASHKCAKLMKVGNGGFSLRKVKSYIDVLNYAEIQNKTISIFNFWNKYEFLECHKMTLNNIWKRIRGVENNLQYYLNSIVQEDVVWSIIVPEVIKSFKVAPINDAIKFSFESDPSYLYYLNGDELPFGCHAWQKNQYKEFWYKFIK